MTHKNGPLRIGIGGPVGSGKTTLTEKLCKAMTGAYSVAAVTNDICTREDALMLARLQALPEERIVGAETGGCPHTAIREDASINLAATFSPDLADPTLCVIPVCQGGDIPRKGGPGITRSDYLVVNKADLASHVNVDLDTMRDDANRMRAGKPFGFTDLSRGKGVSDIVDFIVENGGLRRMAPAAE